MAKEDVAVSGGEPEIGEILEAENMGAAAVVADIVKEHIAPRLMQLEDPDGLTAPVLVLPRGLTAHSIAKFVDEYADAPRRRKGVARFVELASFIAHANRFKDVDSAIFAKPDVPQLVSVLDYHRAGPEPFPRFGEHRGLYEPPLSDEWKAWTGQDTKVMGQAAFAEWLENHITDVADPSTAGDTAKALADLIGCSFASPSKLLELSRGLSIRVDSKMQQTVKLATGEASMQFVASHNDETGAPIKVPGAFLVALPVFRGGAPYQLAVRLRYRAAGGSVSWFFEVYRADRVFAHAFQEACDTAAKETGLPLFVGSPE